MKYTRFEDLPVWQAAIEFALQVFRLTEDRAFDNAGDLRDQLQRSSLSISNNIAEGFERGTTPELLFFIYIARGSAGESRSALRFSERLPRLAHLAHTIAGLIPQAESISRQLRAWADSLQNSPIEGPRHLNDDTRSAYEQKKRATHFLAKLDELRRRAAPVPPPSSASDPRT